MTRCFTSKLNKRILFSYAFLLFTVSVAANCSEDIFLNTQEAIENFDCGESLAGDLIISGPDITNLDGLLGLTEIEGNLIIEGNLLLTDLDGLSDLTYVGGSIFIEYNAQLQNLNGFSQLTGIGSDLSIYKNAGITQLDGLSELNYIGGNFFVFGNPSLLQMGNFPNLTAIGEALFIGDNSNLQQINGLSTLSSIGDFLLVYQNPRLTQLGGLSGLNVVGSYIFIDTNQRLTHLNGLSSLTTIGGFLYLGNNPGLIHLNGLNNLVTVNGQINLVNNLSLNNISGISGITSGVTGFSIYENPALSNCSIASVCRIISGEYNEIFDNGGRCNSIEEVADNCVNEINNQDRCTPPSRVNLTRISPLVFTIEAEAEENTFQVGTSSTSGSVPYNASADLTSIQSGDLLPTPFSENQTHVWLRTVCAEDLVSTWAGPYEIPVSASSNLQSIVLSPNPTYGEVSISQVNAQIIEVYNMNGAQLMNFITRGNTFDLSDLPTGKYNLRIIDTQGNVHFDQVIKK